MTSVVQWIRLYTLLLLPGFESQTHHLACFFVIYLIDAYYYYYHLSLICENEQKIEKHYKEQIRDDLHSVSLYH